MQSPVSTISGTTFPKSVTLCSPGLSMTACPEKKSAPNDISSKYPCSRVPKSGISETSLKTHSLIAIPLHLFRTSLIFSFSIIKNLSVSVNKQSDLLIDKFLVF